MTEVKWATDQGIAPADRPDRERLAPVLMALAANPGRWAELGRYPVARVQSARSRGANIKKRYAGIEYAVQTEGADAVLYLRQSPEEPS